jgi:hypothetical protein
VCERSDRKIKNKIFVTDEVAGEGKTKSASVTEVTENEKQNLCERRRDGRTKNKQTASVRE